jgi:hypothetical protein
MKGRFMDVRRILSELYIQREQVKTAIRLLEGRDPLSEQTTGASAQSVIEIRKAGRPDYN